MNLYTKWRYNYENISIPVELEHMKNICTVASPTIDGLGIMILGEHMQDNEGLSTISYIWWEIIMELAFMKLRKN